MRIKFIGRGTYFEAIRRAVGSSRISEAHIAVNYGSQGDRLRDYRRRYPNIDRLPMLNADQHGNKFQCIQTAEQAGVPVPQSYNTGSRNSFTDGSWIMKPYYSLGGRDISRYEAGASLPDTHYLQEDLSARRRYEIRVHAFAWLNPSQWIFQKRVHDNGEEVLTWNHHTGGRFITIDNPTDPLHDRIRQSVQTLMRAFGYQFGAVDFIVCNAGERGAPLPHYFIEWNLAPGFTLERIQEYYVSAFNTLKTLDMDSITMMIEGGQLSSDLVELNDEDEATPEPPQPTIHNLRMPEPEPQVQWVEPSVLDEPSIHRIVEAQRPMSYEQAVIRDADAEDLRDYEAHMAEMAREMNFCPACGRPVNADVFGFTPRFCTGCGQRVRA